MRASNLVVTVLALGALSSGCSQPSIGSSDDSDFARPLPTTTATTATTPTAPTAPTTPTAAPAPTPAPTPTVTSPAAPAPTATTAPAPTVTPHDRLPPLFQDGVRSAEAAPISGGSLLVTADGATAVAADADRSSVFLVDLATRSVRVVTTEPGEQLGRVVEGPAGTVFVAARRGGAVLALDLASGSVRSRTPVCNAPRGMAYDATANALHVACRSGWLLTLDATSGAVTASVKLDADLRDVLLVGGDRYVTRFRSAEMLRVDASGGVTARATPPAIGSAGPAVAFRSVPLPNGLVLLAHQVESDLPVGTGVSAYNGGGCGGVVQQVLTLASVDGTTLSATSKTAALTEGSPGGFAMASRVVLGAVGPTDVAVSRDGTRVALVASGNSWNVTGDLPNLYVDTVEVASGAAPAGIVQISCNGFGSVQHHAPGEPVAVAFDAAGKYVVQSREPAMLELEGDVFIPLANDSHFDTGFAMFHVNSGSGISCASCHPEGGDDGHVWAFSSLGLRRSQPLEGTVSARAPFHWSGDLPTFDDLFSEVMIKRMALPVIPPEDDVQALKTWLDTIPALAPADHLDPVLVERGRTLFADPALECSTCHQGAAYSDNKLHDVGTGGSFVTPTLLGVGLRAPLLHDGCARTLRDRFGVCGGKGHGGTATLSEADIDALVEFMQSL